MKGSTRNLGSGAEKQLPPSVRTKNRAPRFVSAALVVFSLTTFCFGSSALAYRQRQLSTPIDQLFEEGSNWWTIVDKKAPENCIGLFHSEMTREKEPVLRLRGMIRTNAGSNEQLASFSLRAKFSPFYNLEEIHTTLESDMLSLILESDPEDSTNWLFRTRSVTENRSRKFTRPEPIYLREHAPGMFHFRYPEVVGKTTETLGELALQRLGDGGSKRCQDELSSRGSQAIELDQFIARLLAEQTESAES